MTQLCIHGFQTDQCSSCRTCPHGLESYRCGRCRAAAAATTRRRVVPAPAREPVPESYKGFEIFYEPSLNGWKYRSDDATSPLSYRSVFLARKAIDHLGSAEAAGTASKRKR
jgi:hypothetical protein